MQAPSSVIVFPQQSKSASSSKHPKEKCTVLEWVRNGCSFTPVPLPHPSPRKPKPLPPIVVPPKPAKEPTKQGGSHGHN